MSKLSHGLRFSPIVLLVALLVPTAALASDTVPAPDQIQSVKFSLQTNLDHVWTMMAAGLVFLMQAGFLLLEAGLVRSKNSINVAQKNIADFVMACVVFGAVGFMLMFGASWGGWFGLDGSLFMFNEVPDWTFTFFVFQVVFCGTAATIVSGGMAERMKFSGYLITTVFIAALVYPVFGHWAWGNLLVSDNEPFLAAQGFIDFAGSTVVHSVGAWIALAGIIVLGPRIGKFCEQGKPQQITGHSAMLATLGAIILWVGWIGFNGGSTTAGTPDFAHIIMNTMVAGAFGGMGSMFLGRFMDGIYRPERAINGVLAGLVAITAGCDAVTTWGAITIGFSGGIVGYVGYLILEHWFKLDDAVGVIPVHGFAGAWGTILLAVLATEDKLAVASRWEQFFVQCEGVALGFMWAFGTGYVFFKLMDAFVGIRVSEEHELVGSDWSALPACDRWVSPARPPNRTCTFRYASGSPKAFAKSGDLIQLSSYRTTRT